MAGQVAVQKRIDDDRGACTLTYSDPGPSKFLCICQRKAILEGLTIFLERIDAGDRATGKTVPRQIEDNDVVILLYVLQRGRQPSEKCWLGVVQQSLGCLMLKLLKHQPSGSKINASKECFLNDIGQRDRIVILDGIVNGPRVQEIILWPIAKKRC